VRQVFDKVTVLYEGQQIYFGDTKRARQFFVDMGFDAPEQATTPDFLTSLTNVEERRARPGFENRVPKTPAEFAAAWKASDEYAALKQQLKEYDERYPISKGEQYQEFLASRRAQQSKKV
jgi:ATP-binding cassette subfamily G (WHITE) protein 2 (PDR)